MSLALWFGEEWFARGDGFEVYSTLVARLSPWGRRDDGRLVVRSPLANANATPAEPGLPLTRSVGLRGFGFSSGSGAPMGRTP